jgi:MFS transporter, SP family, inositol transporter
VRDLFRGANLRALGWTGAIYLFWNLAAGTAGIFTPYMVRTLGSGSQVTSLALSCGQTGCCWFSMYWRTAVRGAPPYEAAK